MDHIEQGYRFANDWPQENLAYVSQHYQAGETIPVGVNIEAEQHVLNLEQVKRIIRKAYIISLMDCYCRLTYGHCAAPVKVCLDLNHVAERHIADFGAQEISFEDALQVLAQSHEAGLVHMAYGHGDLYEPGVVNSICSCCSCCCGIFSGVLRFGMFPHLLTTQFRAEVDAPACIDCGLCVDRCQFGALKISNETLSFQPDLCFGCGLCAGACPTYAISLVEKLSPLEVQS